MTMEAISIYLGSKCNLNCAYCHREADANETGVTGKLLQLLDEKKPESIRFIGGEPTLYMDDIKKVVKHCPQAKFRVTTNGILLADNIEYFRKHNFKIIVSFDGQLGENPRGFDPLEDVIDYPDMGISTTICHGNTDFKKILRGFCEAENRIKRPLMFFPHICHHTSKKNEAYSLTLEDVDNLLSEYKYAIGKFWRDYDDFGVINKRYESIFMQLLLLLKADYEFGETYCMSKRRMKVNANGDAFNCSYIRNVPASKNKRYMQKSFPECEKCAYYFMCGGACAQSLSHAIECKFYRGLYEFFTNFIASLPKDKLKRLWRKLP